MFGRVGTLSGTQASALLGGVRMNPDTIKLDVFGRLGTNAVARGLYVGFVVTFGVKYEPSL